AAASNHQGQIVSLFPPAEALDLLENGIDEHLWVASQMPAEHFDHAGLIELLYDAVGEENQRVAGLKDGFRDVAGPLRKEANDGSCRREALEGAGVAHQKAGRVSAV